MEKADDALYDAFRSKDVRFDGRFFIGVSSTKIYCRPICRAKHPKRENCTFFSSAAQAEQAGYRPCLLCRPELAPGRSIVDASSSLAHRAAQLMEENCGTGQSLEALCAKLGCTSRHLRRVFIEEYHVTPIQYLQTCRLLLAKNLLTDTNLSVLDVAMAAGFGSLRRLNDLFQKHYHLSPSALRKNTAKGAGQAGEVAVNIGYRPPYRWEEILGFLSSRAISGIEKIEDGKYMRTVRLPDRNGKVHSGYICVQNNPRKNALLVTLCDALVPVFSQVLACVKHLFDLYCDPDAVYETLQKLDERKPGLCVKGLRVPGRFHAFETSVRAILGQQITVKAANTLAGKIAMAFGTPVKTGISGLTCAFPVLADILSLGENIQEEFGKLGVIAARSRCILELAKSLESGAIRLEGCIDPEAEMQKLMQIKGIGRWTANYIAMRVMGWPDAFLETDAGIRHALPGYAPKELLSISQNWRPWRSYATMNLWNSL